MTLTGRSPQAAVTDPASYRAATWLSFLALMTIGCYTSAIGPALPDLAQRSGVSISEAGAVFTALFCGAMLSTLIAGRAVDRLGRRRPLIIGLVINGTALLLIPWAATWPVLLALFMLLGAGDGIIVVTAHVLVADANRDAEAAALNRLNVFFGVGAVLGPALVALVRIWGGLSPLTLAVFGTAQLVWAVTIMRVILPSHTGGDHPLPAGSTTGTVVRSGLLWLLAGLLLVYVGIEIGLGGWAFSYAREAAGFGSGAAALLSSLFWGALTLGRLLSPVALRWLSPAGLLIAAPVLATSGALLLMIGGTHPVPLIAGILVTGTAFGPVWPVTFALAARAFRGASGAASGILAMVSAGGGLGVPWLQGWVLDMFGPASGIAVTVAGCIGVAALAAVVWSRYRIIAE